jgi:hypothetical protein
MHIYGTPGGSKGEALGLYLGDWCANAAKEPYEQEDLEALSELGDSLARLLGTPYFEPLLSISKMLNTPLDGVGVWDVIGEVARFSATLSAHEARRQGETWERIGEQGLISKSSALQRYDAGSRKRRRERIAALRRKMAEEYPSSRTEGLSATRDDSDPMGR